MIAALNQTFPALVSNFLLPHTAWSLSSAPDNSSEGRLEGTCILLFVLAHHGADKTLSPKFETKSIKLPSLQSVKTKAIPR